MESREIKGIWWNPKYPDIKINGTLDFSPPKSCYLHLEGSFENEDIIFIKGFSKNGKQITLHRCFLTKTSHSIPGFSTSIFHVSFAFIGVEFHSTDDITFKEFKISFSSLDEWVNRTGFKITRLDNIQSVNIKYKKPNDIMLYRCNEFTISLIAKQNGPTRSYIQKGITIQQNFYFKIIFCNTENSLAELMRISSVLQNLLTLALSKPVKTIKLSGKSDKSITKINNVKINNDIVILYDANTSHLENFSIQPMFMLFTLDDIITKTQSTFKNWFLKSEILEPVFSLYFSTLYRSDIYINLKLLSLVQAIEAYSRRTTIVNKKEISNHKTRLNRILSATTTADGTWLEQKLKYSSELSLRQRLKLLYLDYKPILDKLTNLKSFVNDVVNTRNYNVHFDESLKSKAKSGVDLHYICETLKIIIQLLLLEQLKFNRNDALSIIERSETYKHLVIKLK